MVDRELARSEFSSFEKALLEEVINTADSLIVLTDPQGRIKLFNKKAEEVTGFRSEDVLGSSWVERFVPPTHQGKLRRLLKAFQEGRSVTRNERYPLRTRSGEERYIAWNRSFVKDSEGRPRFILSVGHDLTPFRLMELERAHTQTVLDSIADGVVTVDPQLRIITMNKAATQITGFHEQEAQGQSCRDILRGNLCSSGCPLKASVETGKTFVDLESTILNRQNREIPLHVSTTVWRDQDGNAMGGILIFRDLTPITELRKELSDRYSFRDIISKSKVFLDLFQILPDIARSGATVLITGESGTGKELVAKALHDLSPRRERPFVKVNCAALPETLLESELFGYKRGAFTDAKQDKPGRFKLAEGGTLFLDEIGDISPAVQSKLLRVLETKEYEPLGGTRTEKADVRVITATNKNLWAQVQAGSFREDLYYRLNLFPIELPPLRERPEDIPLLIDHFLARLNHTRGRTIVGVTRPALEILLNYSYPGNVRELQNILEHAFILCKSSHIGPDCLPAYLRKAQASSDKGIKVSLDAVERDMIVGCLRRHGGRIGDAAKEMGIHRTTLWRKVKKLGLPRG